MATCSLLATARGRGCRGGGPGDMHERLSLLVPPRMHTGTFDFGRACTHSVLPKTHPGCCLPGFSRRTDSINGASRAAERQPSAAGRGCRRAWLPPGVVATATTAAAARPAQKLDVAVTAAECESSGSEEAWERPRAVCMRPWCWRAMCMHLVQRPPRVSPPEDDTRCPPGIRVTHLFAMPDKCRFARIDWQTSEQRVCRSGPGAAGHAPQPGWQMQMRCRWMHLRRW